MLIHIGPQHIKVGNDGFVQLIDYMGDDKRVVDAARVSYKGSKPKRKDEDLIRYLLKHGHMSPFEHVEFEFHMRMPIFVARQWMRYRTASINEVSRRYREYEGGFWIPDKWRLQDTKNKQGSYGELDHERSELASVWLKYAYEVAQTAYEHMLRLGVSREQARAVLPLGGYTEFYWKNDLRNIFHLLEQRLDSHAQHETREYAVAVLAIIEPLVPVSVGAWKEVRNITIKL